MKGKERKEGKRRDREGGEGNGRGSRMGKREKEGELLT